MKQKKSSTSKALARRKPTKALARRRPTKTVIVNEGLKHYTGRELEAAWPLPAPQVLTDDIALGQLGLVEVKLTDAEEAVLQEPVNLADVRIKPTGQPYLSHPTYTKWLNRAFGRTGWALVPASKPMKSSAGDKAVTVVQTYVLHIHGKPVAFANGEHQYFENNREQTYGDALESTVASALRRCMKRLGIGLELWDKDFLNEWLDKYAVRVKVNVAKRGQAEELKTMWRRKTDKPFYNETRGRTEAPPATARPAPPKPPEQRSNPRDGEPVTPDQLKRLHTIATRHGRTSAEMSVWLKAAYNLDTSKGILRRDYDAIVRAVEASGSLPLPQDDPREPGEEG